MPLYFKNENVFSLLLWRALKLTHDVNHVIRLFVKFETQNTQLKMKLKMLLCKPWRTRVLKQLGGMRRLRSWEAAVVWPAEFRAAIAAEKAMSEEDNFSPKHYSPHGRTGPISHECPRPPQQEKEPVIQSGEWVSESDEGEKSPSIPTLCCKGFIPPKLQHRLFPPLA